MPCTWLLLVMMLLYCYCHCYWCVCYTYPEYLLPTPTCWSAIFFHDPIALNIFEHKYFKHFELMFFPSHFYIHSETDAHVHCTHTHTHTFVTLREHIWNLLLYYVPSTQWFRSSDCMWASFIESRSNELKCSILRFPLLMSKTSLQITTT